MCTSPEIFLRKQEFLARYNPNKNIDSALANSITASLQRNELWGFDASTGRKDLIRLKWGDALKAISQKYESSLVPEAIFEQDIQDLKAMMNNEYQEYFRSSGFKISHAQKSLAVFLKIMWAWGKFKMPPLCPVDRTMLIAAGERSPSPWTDVNTIAEYRKQIRILKRGLKNHRCDSLACWELCTFNPGT